MIPSPIVGTVRELTPAEARVEREAELERLFRRMDGIALEIYLERMQVHRFDVRPGLPTRPLLGRSSEPWHRRRLNRARSRSFRRRLLVYSCVRSRRRSARGMHERGIRGIVGHGLSLRDADVALVARDHQRCLPKSRERAASSRRRAASSANRWLFGL